jgi:hypothetical protein
VWKEDIGIYFITRRRKNQTQNEQKEKKRKKNNWMRTRRLRRPRILNKKSALRWNTIQTKITLAENTFENEKQHVNKHILKSETKTQPVTYGNLDADSHACLVVAAGNVVVDFVDSLACLAVDILAGDVVDSLACLAVDSLACLAVDSLACLAVDSPVVDVVDSLACLAVDSPVVDVVDRIACPAVDSLAGDVVCSLAAPDSLAENVLG